MTKESYKKIVDANKEKFKILKAKYDKDKELILISNSNVLADYLYANSKYEIGDTIEYKDYYEKWKIGYILRYSLDANLDIEYVLKKSKNKGTEESDFLLANRGFPIREEDIKSITEEDI